MVRLAVSTPDSPPLNSGSTQVIVQPNSNNNSSSATNNSYVHQTDPLASQAATTTPPAQASVSPTQQMAQNIPPGAIPLNQMSPHHMPPPFHHPHSGSNGAHLHDHSNGHHHNGLYLGPAYANEFYPAGADGAPTHGAYFIPQEMCPAHTQLCTVHPEYGENTLSISWNLSARSFGNGHTREELTEASWINSPTSSLEHHLTSAREPLSMRSLLIYYVFLSVNLLLSTQNLGCCCCGSFFLHAYPTTEHTNFAENTFSRVWCEDCCLDLALSWELPDRRGVQARREKFKDDCTINQECHEYILWARLWADAIRSQDAIQC